jgi:hypothetical protein
MGGYRSAEVIKPVKIQGRPGRYRPPDTLIAFLEAL